VIPSRNVGWTNTSRMDVSDDHEMSKNVDGLPRPPPVSVKVYKVFQFVFTDLTHSHHFTPPSPR
jgi:hypothetical protein